MRFFPRPQSEWKKNTEKSGGFGGNKNVNLCAESKVSLIIQLDKNRVHDRKSDDRREGGQKKWNERFVVNESIVDLVLPCTTQLKLNSRWKIIQSFATLTAFYSSSFRKRSFKTLILQIELKSITRKGGLKIKSNFLVCYWIMSANPNKFFTISFCRSNRQALYFCSTVSGISRSTQILIIRKNVINIRCNFLCLSLALANKSLS